MYSVTLRELRRALVLDPTAGWKALFLVARAESQCREDAAEKRLAWRTVRLTSDRPGRVLCDTTRYLLCEAGGRGASPAGRTVPQPKPNGVAFLDDVMDAVWTGDRSKAESALGRIWGLDFQFVRWLFGYQLKILNFAGLRDKADALSTFWAQCEHKFRSEAETVAFSARFFENIGHATIRLAIGIAEEHQFFPSKSRHVAGSPVAHNHFLFTEISRGLDVLGTAEVRARQRLYVHPAYGTMPYQLSTGEVLSLGRFISRCLDVHFLRSDQPLVTFSPTLEERAIADLRALGLDLERPIVTLHVREGGFDAKSVKSTDVKNGDIQTYLPTIDMLVRGGFQVVRLGDPTMTPLGDRDGFIDYPFSKSKSDYLDVYLASVCDFHIGTSSGMSHIPLLFDRPVVYTNWMPLGEFIGSRRTLTLPKTLRDRYGARIPLHLSIAQHSNVYDPIYFELDGIEVCDNTPDEIQAAVSRMIEYKESPVNRLSPLKLCLVSGSEEGLIRSVW